MSVSTKYFTVAAPQGMSTIRLDSRGSATCQITVKNVSGSVIDGRAVLVSLPIVSPRAGAVEKNWVKIDGPTDRHFPVDQEEVFSIKIAVPQKQGEAPAPGNYSFRLDVINVARPDDSGDQSQALGFTVSALPPKPPSKWPLIALVAALVLIVVGVTVWLLTRSKSQTTTPPEPTPTARPTPRPTATPPRNPDACIPGFVWREVVPSDHVCVTPAVRAQVVSDNQLAAARRNPLGGSFGPDTCLVGFVWRDAVANDHVCVTGAVRAQAAADNAQAANRRVGP